MIFRGVPASLDVQKMNDGVARVGVAASTERHFAPGAQTVVHSPGTKYSTKRISSSGSLFR